MSEQVFGGKCIIEPGSEDFATLCIEGNLKHYPHCSPRANYDTF